MKKADAEALKQGSSPLTRGKRIDARVFAGELGLIPAHAGKTTPTSACAVASGAHPRSRGENRGPIWNCERCLGSSPLTRGKHLDGDGRHPVGRLIPAHAGKTLRFVGRPASAWAHPRSRGENCTPRRASPWTTGSSPLTRGKLTPRPAALALCGLIPAHAGKTSIGCVPLTIPWAHPRSRGENLLHDRVSAAGGGSSPLTRGKRHEDGPRELPGGLIPAHAGKTRGAPRAHADRVAHPRSRGENPQIPPSA